MSPITSHVLDTARGGPAAGVPLTLEILNDDQTWTQIGAGVTNDDGRVANLLEPGELREATYRITFDTATYFKRIEVTGFYPEVPVLFHITNTAEHYHIPLLLSPFGFSTYRGS